MFPDCPPFQVPITNITTLRAMIGFGTMLGGPLSLETFNGKHVATATGLILLICYMLLCIIF